MTDEFRAANPSIPVRILLFYAPMTPYGDIETAHELATGWRRVALAEPVCNGVTRTQASNGETD